MLVIGHRPLVGHCINRTRDRDAWLQEGLIRAYNTYAYLDSVNQVRPTGVRRRRHLRPPVDAFTPRRIDASNDASTHRSTHRLRYLPVPYLVPVRM
jgi:hypothetical protein